MNNSVIEHQKTLFSYQVYNKINPIYKKIAPGASNNISLKRKYKIPISTREFGKEIHITNNLTVYNNQEVIKTKKTFDPKNYNNKNSKTIHYNQIKNYERSLMEINKKNKNNSIKNKFSESNKENSNVNIENVKKKKNDSIMIFNEDEDKDNNITIINNDDVYDDVEMKDVNKDNKNVNNDLVIYNKYPQNVDEYFDEIFTELKNNEEKYLPDPNYMLKQKDINHRMRAILIDWLIDVHLKYKMVPQTMYISVNLIDRYLSKNETNRIKLQLVGVASMFIATKYEEIYPPELKDFVYITDNAYNKSDVLEMESKMLNSLNFDITFPTQCSFLEMFGKKLNLDKKTFNLAWFLMELSLIHYKMLKFKMSQIAASAILIAIKALNYFAKIDFEKNTGYSENSLQECIKEINNIYIYNATHSLQAIRKKFLSKKYDEVAKIHLY